MSRGFKVVSDENHIIALGGEEFEFVVFARTQLNIKDAFNKPYEKVIAGIDKLTIFERIKFLHAGLKDKNIELSDFEDHILNTMGDAEIYEAIEWLIIQLNYPGMSKEDFIKKMRAQEEMQTLASKE